MIESENIDLSVVIACYNEMQVIQSSVPRVQQILEQTKYSYEIILFDDGSTDGTRSIGPELAKKSNRIRWYAHDKNYGRGRTVSDGIKLAKGKIAGFIDMDLEIPAEYILPLVLEIEKGADIAVASRLEHSNFNHLPFYRRSVALAYWLLRCILSTGYTSLVKLLLKVKLNDTEVGFKFFNREKILPILDEVEDNHWFWDTEIMARSYYRGLNIKEYPALFLKNIDRKSTVKVFKDSLDYFFKLLRFWQKTRRIHKEGKKDK